MKQSILVLTINKNKNDKPQNCFFYNSNGGTTSFAIFLIEHITQAFKQMEKELYENKINLTNKEYTLELIKKYLDKKLFYLESAPFDKTVHKWTDKEKKRFRGTTGILISNEYLPQNEIVYELQLPNNYTVSLDMTFMGVEKDTVDNEDIIPKFKSFFEMNKEEYEKFLEYYKNGEEIFFDEDKGCFVESTD